MGDFAESLAAAESAYDLRPFVIGEDDLSSCPCFTIDQPGFHAEGRCWRVGHDYHENRDGRCCVHVKGDPGQAARLKALLDEMDWYGEWALEVES